MAAIAARYARALADVASSPRTPAGTSDQLRTQLRAFLEALEGSGELRNVLANPAVPAARKRAILQAIGQRLNLPQIGLNFLYVLVDHRRIGVLKPVLDLFETMLDERQGVVRAEITTPAVLAAGERELMEQSLRRLTGKQVRVDYAVDSSLIGGAVTRIGSTVYDGSVIEQLRQMRERLSR